MRTIYLFLILILVGKLPAKAQVVDTLKNMLSHTQLITNQYTSNWGYYSGHNYLGRQQYAEKYVVTRRAKIVGIVSHLGGKTSATSMDSVAFNIWTIGANKFPATLLVSKVIQTKDLDASGKAFMVMLDKPIQVPDSFFVAFDLLDYSHHDHPDTLALLYAPPGSRSQKDLANFGRNVVQVHSHGAPVWRDFYTQNFTPIATHFAIFPIVEFENVTTATDEIRGFYDLTIYPQPASGQLYFKTSTKESFVVNEVSLFNLQGQMVYRNNSTTFVSSEPQKLDISHLQKGVYVLKLQNNQQVISRKIVVQ
jgi:hypothetical protein